MDQYVNNRQNEIIWKIVANPTDTGYLYTYNLQRLAEENPQSGLLHALYAHSSNDPAAIQRAAAYFDNRTLFKLMHNPEGLREVTDDQVYSADKKNTVQATAAELDESYYPASDYSLPDFTDSPSNYFSSEVVTAEPEATVSNWYSANEEHAALITEDVPDESVYLLPDEEQELAKENALAENSEPNEQNTLESFRFNMDEYFQEAPKQEPGPVEEIDDEVYDEIVGIENITIGASEFTQPVTHTMVEEEEAESEVQPVQDTAMIADEVALENWGIAVEEQQSADRRLEIQDEAEKLIYGNIAATDYFAFDNKFGDKRTVEEQPSANEQSIVNSTQPQVNPASAEHTDISPYHDDKMPYTFMWWLAKTRREHAGIYQPYVPLKPVKLQQDELQQQYIENIFHLNAVEELDRSTNQNAVPDDEPKRKEDEIIERFIQEEPHIHPPSVEKLDNENKAKKSAEDNFELVTETLAKIYTDQMLYHKAIATYKKLMLKFPEKSGYFADQIELLEKKIN